MDTMRQGQQYISGPHNISEQASWLAEIKQWRQERLFRLGYSDEEYRRLDLAWTQRNFIQTQMMVEDRYFYDPLTRSYTVARYLDDLEERYGGIESVLIWPTYPNIGIDNRNQFDLLHAMPGGIAGVRAMVEQFHERGVRVLFPVMPWDHGTRAEDASIWTTWARLLAEVGADGLNGDTLFGVPQAFRRAADETGRALAIEPENGLEGGDALAWNTMSWGYWQYSFVPVISAYKWLEPRHMVHICNRWASDHTDDLQHAFFNGVGFESWENVWSIWNGMTPRDAEALKRLSTIERHFAGLLVSPEWEPHTPTLRYGLFASRFPSSTQVLWTLVNRNDYALDGPQLCLPFVAGRQYLDLWHGVVLQPEVDATTATLSFAIEERGYGAVLALDAADNTPEIQTFLRKMRELSKSPLRHFAHKQSPLPQQLVEIPLTRLASTAPEEMVRIPAAIYDFQVSGVEVEGDNRPGVDIQYPWEDTPRRHHRQRITVNAFAIDRYCVTNAAFKRFLDATQYYPLDDYNFLKDWHDGIYPHGWDEAPVTWVALEDARAYALWAGKRLPHEWEWQYASQGRSGLLYPWGNQWQAECVPVADTGRTMRGPSSVKAHPQGASPFGVMDLVGNVWQWTDEYRDEHTRTAVLRGGSYYHPQGSGWYFPNTYKLTEHGKYLLMAPGKDRAGTLGFRCVLDLEQ